MRRRNSRTELSGPTARPPYRATGHRYTYRTYEIPGIASYRAIPPPPPPQLALSQLRAEGGRGYRGSSCPLEGIALYGGIAEIVSPIAV